MGISLLLGDLVRLVLANARAGRKERRAHAVRRGQVPEGQEKEAPEDCPQAAGSGAVKIRCAEQPGLREFAAILRSCDS